jgi:hypothetical protein
MSEEDASSYQKIFLTFRIQSDQHYQTSIRIENVFHSIEYAIQLNITPRYNRFLKLSFLRFNLEN